LIKFIKNKNRIQLDRKLLKIYKVMFFNKFGVKLTIYLQLCAVNKRQSGIVLPREPQTRELFTLAFTFLPLTGN
jgi:hypothetical protein